MTQSRVPSCRPHLNNGKTCFHPIHSPPSPSLTTQVSAVVSRTHSAPGALRTSASLKAATGSICISSSTPSP